MATGTPARKQIADRRGETELEFKTYFAERPIPRILDKEVLVSHNF